MDETMKPSKLLPAGFLAMVLAGTGALVATAQTADDAAPTRAEEAAQPAQFRGGDREHRGGGARFARGGHRGGGEMLRTLFDAVDTDGDGTVTQAEIDAYRAARLTEVDASGDGALSIEEFDTLYRAFTRSRMVDAFQELDADGDGVISADEMDSRVSGFVRRLDRDGDGELTLLPRASGN